MKSSKLYITVKVVLLVAVIFFSSGFTTIVKYCSMSQSSECCYASEHSTAQNDDVSVSGQNPSCLTVKVIGGLSDTKAISTSESSIKSLTAEAIASHSSAISILSTPFHYLSFIYTNDAAPPGAEIYIRIGSLLI